MSIRSDIVAHIKTHGPSTAGALFENLKGLDDRKQLSNALYQMAQCGQLVKVEVEGVQAYEIGAKPVCGEDTASEPAEKPEAATRARRASKAPRPRKSTTPRAVARRHTARAPKAKAMDVAQHARLAWQSAQANLNAYIERFREHDSVLDGLVVQVKATRELMDAAAA